MKIFQCTLILAIQAYRWVVSPAKMVLFGPAARCRYTPVCSQYGLEAIRTHGAWKGLGLTLKRILRCHPWGGCGHDPVPPARSPGALPGGMRGLALLGSSWVAGSRPKVRISCSGGPRHSHSHD